MKKLAKLFIGASLLTAVFASCSNGGLINNDTLDAPELTATVTENGVAVIKWDEVKDAASYSVYYKAPGTKEWNYTWNNNDSNNPYTKRYYVASLDKTESEYEFKVVAHPDQRKINLLASEAEISVETPDAWVDTAAFAASDIKLTLVANTLNQYKLQFPVNAGFKYSAKLVKATTAATTSAADLFTQTGTGSWDETIYLYNGTEQNPTTWSNSRQTAMTDASNAYDALTENLQAIAEAGTYTDFDQTATNAAIAAADTGDNSQIEALIALITNTDEQEATNALYTTYKTKVAELAKYTTDITTHTYSTSVNTNIRNGDIISGASFVTELDDDDNEVSPIFDSNVNIDADGAEYRVIVKMEPVNTGVATTKYILSSQTVKFDSTGLVSVPRNVRVDWTNSTTTKWILTFIAERYNGTVMPVSNYRIYQVLNTKNYNADGIDIGETTALKYLGNPVLTDKSSSYNPDEEEYIKYEFKAVLDEDTSKVDYTYTFYVAYTDQNGDVSWFYFQ